MYNAAFAVRQLDMHYGLLDVSAADVERAFARLRADDCIGANVTMPHKRAAATAADVRSPEVERCGAANLLVHRDSQLFAHNTDVEAMVGSLRRRERSIRAGLAVIWGAGGSAAAALEAFRSVTPRAITILARHPAAAVSLIREPAGWLPAPIDVQHFDQVRAASIEAQLIVNATPIGMGNDDVSPVQAADLDQFKLVYDLVYRRPGPTDLQKQALAAGSSVCDGLHHLLEQALPTYARYTGQDPPREVMLSALAKSVGRTPLDWGSDGAA